MAELVMQPANNPKPPPPQWVKGVSGNPSGRPKNSALRMLLAPHRRAMIARLLRVMREGKDEQAIRAIGLMLAYTDGVPRPASVDDLSDAEVLALVSNRAERMRQEREAA